MGRYIKTTAVVFLILMAAGCKRDAQSPGPKYGNTPVPVAAAVYHFAVHPLHNPTKLTQEYQPLMDYLNARLKGARLELEASRDYANFEQKYRDREPEFILPNPWQTLQAMKAGYEVIAMAGEPEDFKGIFIVRKDGGIEKPADLKGKVVSYPSPTALAACIMPQFFLHTHGLDVGRDMKNRYVGSQESSIMNVYLKTTAAGATWPPPWRAFQKDHPAEAAELKEIWETETLVNNSIMVRGDVPKELSGQVLKYLAGLDENREGKAILAGMETARFIPASGKDYAVARSYIERFEKEVRKVETK